MKDKEQKPTAEDENLRRMLSTPPKPFTPKKPAKIKKKKPKSEK